MTIWLTADLHLGHAMVANLRGFDNVEQHDATIIRHINHLVQPLDTLWILGDVAMGGWKDSIQKVWDIDALTIHCVLGNHDRPHPSMSSAQNHLNEFHALSGFTSVQTMASIRYSGTDFLASHFPYSGDHTDEDRFDQYRLIDNGVPLFHGHTHSNEKFSLSSKGTPQIHVGMDAWNMYPVNIFDAVQLLGR